MEAFFLCRWTPAKKKRIRLILKAFFNQSSHHEANLDVTKKINRGIV
jgi:hypothetical protein